ncbi:CHAP domain-containing protein [Macrococcus bovicus]|uniref:CHAP domain-containing protein n=1 Tax=Macrococcus bovicus TaxID=69968 RepID=UPI0025A59E95|nr:CHAP domain-containing protein [Macrococcus bovicus]WJP98318.1 CHAP domain-containing protein [Macrococcus bovicus]
MKKMMMSILTVLMLLTFSTAVEQPTAHAYSNPVKYKAANYYTWGSCAYYAFNRRAQLGRYVSNQWGNAKNWAYNASRSGYTVSRKPIKGAVLVSQLGYYGHVAVVEKKYTNGSIVVSEMNYPRQGVKTYRTIPSYQVGNYQYIY